MACQSVLEKKNGSYTSCQSATSLQNSCSPIVSSNLNRHQSICLQIGVAQCDSEINASNSVGPQLSSGTTCEGQSPLDFSPIGGSDIDINRSELPHQSQMQFKNTCQLPHSVYNDHGR